MKFHPSSERTLPFGGRHNNAESYKTAPTERTQGKIASETGALGGGFHLGWYLFSKQSSACSRPSRLCLSFAPEHPNTTKTKVRFSPFLSQDATTVTIQTKSIIHPSQSSLRITRVYFCIFQRIKIHLLLLVSNFCTKIRFHCVLWLLRGHVVTQSRIVRQLRRSSRDG